MSTIRTGYKQTEVGVIPEDWETATMLGISSQIMDYRGRTPKKLAMDWGGGDIPALSAANVKMGFIDFQEECYFGSEDLYRRWMTKGDVAKGDVLFTTEAPLGNVALVPDDRKYILSQRTVLLKILKQKVSNRFLFQVMRSDGFQRILADYSSGSTAKGIQRKKFEQLSVPLPLLAEQEAIAEVLSDADALIDSLEQLLAKKRNLKQGTMQELLTGKKRLPRFSGEWTERALREICWFQEGPGVRNTQFTATGVKLLNGTNIFRGVLNLDTTSRYISEREACGAYAHFMADAGDIVIASSGITVERLHEKIAVVRVIDLPFCMNTSTIRFKPISGALTPGFLYHFLASNIFKQMIGGQATGSAQLNFGPSHVAKVVCFLPPIAEQAAIADILSDMDAEIAELESQLTKTRALKQGMMQKLLTGEIRLVWH